LKSGDAYANKLFEEYNGVAMTHFPQLSKEDINDILAYVEQPKPKPKVAATAGASAKTTAANGSGVSTNLILGILAIVLVLLIIILVMINKTLTRFAKEKNIEI